MGHPNILEELFTNSRRFIERLFWARYKDGINITVVYLLWTEYNSVAICLSVFFILKNLININYELIKSNEINNYSKYKLESINKLVKANVEIKLESFDKVKEIY